MTTPASPNTEWKAITVPKLVYLPTLPPAGSSQFKDSGLQVKPTDKIEILPGSATMRVNGVLYTLMIPVDNLRLDENNCVVLDKPAARVGSLSSGDGHSSAYVGRLGSRPMPTQSGDYNEAPSSIGFGSGARQPGPQMYFNDDMEMVMAPSQLVDPADIDPTTFAEDAIIREITLKDGTKAKVYIDPTSGKPCSAPFRMYSGIGIDPKEAMRLMAEQDASAVSVAGNRGPQPLEVNYAQQPTSRAPVVRTVQAAEPAAPQAAPPAPPAASSGNINLDGFIGLATKTGAQGFPLGQITCLSAPQAVRDKLQGPQAPCTSLEAVFARIHLAKTPTVFLRLPEDLTDAIRLELAELLPTLAEVIGKHGQVALVILTPPWTPPPALLTYIPTLCLSAQNHATDPRFWTFTCTKGAPAGSQPTASFPG